MLQINERPTSTGVTNCQYQQKTVLAGTFRHSSAVSKVYGPNVVKPFFTQLACM